MRKTLYSLGWVVLFFLPVLFTAEVIYTQDLPPVQPWKWAVLAGAVLVIYFARNRDDVLHHHIA